MWIHPAEPHIEQVAFSKTPAVAFHVGAEVKFRDLAANGALRAVHIDLGFLRRDYDFSAYLRSQVTRHGAEGSSGSNQHSSPQRVVDNPPFRAVAFQAHNRRRREESRAATPQQIIVKFKSPDTVADWLAIPHFDDWSADVAGAKSRHRLQHAPRR